MPKKHKTDNLPLWAKAIIQIKDLEIARLRKEKETIQRMHFILSEPQRHWYVLNSNAGEAPLTDLWYFSKNYPLRLCSLGPKDVIFVGRGK